MLPRHKIPPILALLCLAAAFCLRPAIVEALSDEPPAAASLERVILSVTLNGEARGEYFAYISAEKDFLLKPEDLDVIGLREIKGDRRTMESEEYISLGSIKGLEFSLDERNLVLELTASPYLLSKNIKSLMPLRRLNVNYPRENSAFLNYRLLYSDGDTPNLPLFNISGKVGARAGDVLFLTDSSYTTGPTDNKLLRLMSSITYEDRAELQWLVFGDFFASSGDLGTNLNMGGVSFSKVYKLDPYFIRQPTLDLSGVVPLASEAEIYLDGVLIGRERLQPGEFELKDIYYYGGMRTVEVVIKDPFGKEQRIIHPFYFTDILLKQGLHEYSYNIGLLRERYGIESNSYGGGAVSAYHRFGLTDSLNLGVRAEAGEGIYNLGPQLAYRLLNWGILTSSLAVSAGDGTGLAGSVHYVFQTRKLSARALLKGYTERYATVGSKDSAESVKFEGSIGAGYVSEVIGSIALDYSVSEKYSGRDRKAATVTYTTNLAKNLSFFATLRNVRDSGDSNEFFLGLSYYPGREYSISANYQRAAGSSIGSLQAQKTIPRGEGYGYRATVESGDSASGGRYTAFNPYLQYNSKYGIYTGEYRLAEGGGSPEFYSLSASGAVVYADGLAGLTRPVGDSFGFIKAGDLGGVRVLRDGAEVGRTGADGAIVVPDLRAYNHNRISIEPSDIPIDYRLSSVDVYLSPSIWSGSCVFFDVENVQAFTGTVFVLGDADMTPLEFYEVRLRVNEDKEIAFPTGRGGEFYFENILPKEDGRSGPADCRRLGKKSASRLLPGVYRASFEFRERICEFDMVLPNTDDVVVDLGKNVCKMK